MVYDISRLLFDIFRFLLQISMITYIHPAACQDWTAFAFIRKDCQYNYDNSKRGRIPVP